MIIFNLVDFTQAFFLLEMVPLASGAFLGVLTWRKLNKEMRILTVYLVGVLNLEVCENDLFGIAGNYNVNLKLTHLNTCNSWQNQLTEDVLNMIGEESSALTYFPNILTFNENPDNGLISLEPTQVNMLGNLAYWIVNSQKEIYTSLLTGNSFN